MNAGAIEEADGRWRWAMHEPRPNGFWLDFGIVTFETKAEALEDMEMQLAAERDETGRLILPKQHIHRLIRALAQPCPDCEATYFGGVFWHERDEGGCNWSVSTMSWSKWPACLEHIRDAALQLRAHYSIPDEE